MKKLALATLLFASLGLANIGVINTSILFKDHPEFKIMDDNFKNTFADRKEELKNDKEQIEADEAALDKKIKSRRWKQSAIEADALALEDKKALFREKEKILNTQMKQAVDEGRKKILQDIQTKTTQYATKNGYEVILDSASVVYIKDAQDITQKVLEFIKAK